MLLRKATAPGMCDVEDMVLNSGTNDNREVKFY